MAGFAGVAVFQSDRVLLVQQRDYVDPHRLECPLPSGHTEAGEAPAEAAAREVLEETGCALQSTHLRLVSVVTNTHLGHDISSSWNFTATSTHLHLDPDNGPNGEVVAAEWISIETAIASLVANRYASVREPAVHFLRTKQRGLHWRFELTDPTHTPRSSPGRFHDSQSRVTKSTSDLPEPPRTLPNPLQPSSSVMSNRYLAERKGCELICHDQSTGSRLGEDVEDELCELPILAAGVRAALRCGARVSWMFR